MYWVSWDAQNEQTANEKYTIAVETLSKRAHKKCQHRIHHRSCAPQIRSNWFTFDVVSVWESAQNKATGEQKLHSNSRFDSVWFSLTSGFFIVPNDLNGICEGDYWREQKHANTFTQIYSSIVKRFLWFQVSRCLFVTGNDLILGFYQMMLEICASTRLPFAQNTVTFAEFRGYSLFPIHSHYTLLSIRCTNTICVRGALLCYHKQ